MKTFLYSALAITLSFGLFSCNENEGSADDSSTDSTMIDGNMIATTDTIATAYMDTAVPVVATKVEAFTEWPPEIDGCSCYFASDKDAFKSDSYLWMSDYDSVSFMMIDGELVKFQLKNNLTTEEKKMESEWMHPEYTLHIKTTEQSQVDETWQHEGTLTLKSKGTVVYEHAISGECGC